MRCQNFSFSMVYFPNKHNFKNWLPFQNYNILKTLSKGLCSVLLLQRRKCAEGLNVLNCCAIYTSKHCTMCYFVAISRLFFYYLITLISLYKYKTRSLMSSLTISMFSIYLSKGPLLV